MCVMEVHACDQYGCIVNEQKAGFFTLFLENFKDPVVVNEPHNQGMHVSLVYSIFYVECL